MSSIIANIANPEILNNFVETQPHAEVLQSSFWGNMQEKEGRKVWNTGIYEHSELKGSCVFIRYSLPFGKCWLYSPRPITNSKKSLTQLASYEEKLAKKENAIFWKIEGINPLLLPLQKGEIQRGSPLQPPETFILDLTLSEDELLQRMKPKTRYNIQLALKREVTVRWSQEESAVHIFYSLLTATTKRQKIRTHGLKHYLNILGIIGRENTASLVIGTYKSTPIAANLVTFYGDTATYLHGGTGDTNRNLMAPYLLQWDAIKEAKRRGCRYYDLGGCAVTRGKIAEWKGITRFKEGFGGELVQFGETYDVVFQKKWYNVHKTAHAIKKLLE